MAYPPDALNIDDCGWDLPHCHTCDRVLEGSLVHVTVLACVLLWRRKFVLRVEAVGGDIKLLVSECFVAAPVVERGIVRPGLTS